MRKLTQICTLDSPNLLALDDNGELWFGTLQETDDERRVISWSPVNRPKDGASFTEPQLTFFDKWEKDARERLKRDAEASGKAVSLAAQEPDDTGTTGGEAEDSSDDRVEDGEGADPDLGPGGGVDQEGRD